MDIVKESRHLLRQVDQVVQNHEKNLRVSGNGFSFIHALDLEADEARFHTRLIGYLLNPKAGHHQGDKFLKLFFAQLGINEPTDGYTVEMEKYIGPVDLKNITGGIIDLFICNSQRKIGYAIEVKIYAGEQEKQLERYYNYLKTNFKIGKRQVYYLTLEGDESHFHSEFSDYKSVSFKNEILEWIESCRIASIDQPIIRESLTQYIANIKRLTNQNSDEIMDNEVIKLITSNDSNLTAYFSLLETQYKIRRIMIERFASNLKRIGEATGRFKISYSQNLGKINSSIEFTFSSNPSEKLLIYWLSNWGVVGIGILTGKNESESLREEMFRKLENLRLGKYRGELKNWVWLMNIDSMMGKPQLNSSDWAYFNEDQILNQVMSWVNQVIDAYQAIQDKQE